MNRPTPGPSQEGNSASVPDIAPLLRRGWGWVHGPNSRQIFWRCSLSMNRPLTPSLSPSDGERVVPQSRDRVRGGSWSQMRAQKRMEASHELPPPVAASRQSAAGCRSHELRRSAETPLRRFMAPSRVYKTLRQVKQSFVGLSTESRPIRCATPYNDRIRMTSPRRMSSRLAAS